MVKELKDDEKEFNFFFENHGKKDGWTLYVEKDTAKLYYKKEENMSMMSTMCEIEINAPLTHVLAVSLESDLYKDVQPMISDVKVFKTLSAFRELSWTLMKMPLPWGDRDMLCKTAGYLDAENKRFILIMKSVDQPKWFGVDCPPPAKKITRCEVNHTCYMYEYLGPKKTRVSGIFNMNMKLGGIPDGLMDLMMKKMGLEELDNMKKFSEDAENNVYGKRIQQKPDVYEMIKEALEN